MAPSRYRNVVVPMLEEVHAEHAVEVACRLAADRHGSITAISVIEVPPLLPLDAHMKDEEADVRMVQNRAVAIGDAYGVPVVTRVVRAREAGAAVLDELEHGGADLVVIGAMRTPRTNKRAVPFGRDVQRVLRKAPCRVMLVAAALGA